MKGTVIDERQLVKPVSKFDVQTLTEFKESMGKHKGVRLIIETQETTQDRATQLLDLGEAMLARLFGDDDNETSVVTAQSETKAQIRVSSAATARVARAMGLASLEKAEFEDFLAARIATENNLLLLRFENTNMVTSPVMTIEFASGRTLVADRAQRFR